MEPFYPLHVYVCEKCLLVQLEQFSNSARYFFRLCVFLIFFGFVAGPCKGLRRHDC